MIIEARLKGVLRRACDTFPKTESAAHQRSSRAAPATKLSQTSGIVSVETPLAADHLRSEKCSATFSKCPDCLCVSGRPERSSSLSLACVSWTLSQSFDPSSVQSSPLPICHSRETYLLINARFFAIGNHQIMHALVDHKTLLRSFRDWPGNVLAKEKQKHRPKKY